MIHYTIVVSHQKRSNPQTQWGNLTTSWNKILLLGFYLNFWLHMHHKWFLWYFRHWSCLNVYFANFYLALLVSSFFPGHDKIIKHKAPLNINHKFTLWPPLKTCDCFYFISHYLTAFIHLSDAPIQTKLLTSHNSLQKQYPQSVWDWLTSSLRLPGYKLSS